MDSDLHSMADLLGDLASALQASNSYLQTYLRAIRRNASHDATLIENALVQLQRASSLYHDVRRQVAGAQVAPNAALDELKSANARSR